MNKKEVWLHTIARDANQMDLLGNQEEVLKAYAEQYHLEVVGTSRVLVNDAIEDETLKSEIITLKTKGVSKILAIDFGNEMNLLERYCHRYGIELVLVDGNINGL